MAQLQAWALYAQNLRIKKLMFWAVAEEQCVETLSCAAVWYFLCYSLYTDCL